MRRGRRTWPFGRWMVCVFRPLKCLVETGTFVVWEASWRRAVHLLRSEMAWRNLSGHSSDRSAYECRNDDGRLAVGWRWILGLDAVRTGTGTDRSGTCASPSGPCSGSRSRPTETWWSSWTDRSSSQSASWNETVPQSKEWTQVRESSARGECIFWRSDCWPALGRPSLGCIWNWQTDR